MNAVVTTVNGVEVGGMALGNPFLAIIGTVAGNAGQAGQAAAASTSAFQQMLQQAEEGNRTLTLVGVALGVLTVGGIAYALLRKR